MLGLEPLPYHDVRRTTAYEAGREELRPTEPLPAGQIIKGQEKRENIIKQGDTVRRETVSVPSFHLCSIKGRDRTFQAGKTIAMYVTNENMTLRSGNKTPSAQSRSTKTQTRRTSHVHTRTTPKPSQRQTSGERQRKRGRRRDWSRRRNPRRSQYPQ